MDRQYIENFIADNLHELAWHNKYPVNEGVALWSFVNGIKDTGLRVSGSDPLHFFYVFQHSGENYELTAKMSKEDILTGWKHTPRSCPNSLYDSVYELIDRLYDEIEAKYPKWKTPRDLADAMEKERTNLGHNARDAMEKHLLSFFEKYHEGVLAPIGVNDSKIHSPQILDNLFKSGVISLDRINEALAYSFGEERGVSSTYSTVAFLRNGEPFDDPDWSLSQKESLDRDCSGFRYLISPSSIEDYIWGAFLLELYKLKNYPLAINPNEPDEDEESSSPLEIAFDAGWRILQPLRL